MSDLPDCTTWSEAARGGAGVITERRDGRVVVALAEASLTGVSLCPVEYRREVRH